MTLYTRNSAPDVGPGARAHRRRDPDPIEELATIDDRSQDNRPDRPHLSVTDGPQPGFGPDGTKEPEFTGDPALGIDPRQAAVHQDDED